MTVELTNREIAMACYIGMCRRVESSRAEMNHNPPMRPDEVHAQWGIDIEGALAEMAYAKAMDSYFIGGVGTMKAPDVSKMQVRSTPRDDGRLILRENDADDDTYVLVAGRFGKYKVVGSISGRDGKQERYRMDPGERGAAYFVPQQDLAPLGGSDAR